jgi:hypothetical protein
LTHQPLTAIFSRSGSEFLSVVILPELNAAFCGIELMYLLAIGIWLLGSGVGAILSRRGVLPSRSALSWLIIISPQLLPFDVCAVRAVPQAFIWYRNPPFRTFLFFLETESVPVNGPSHPICYHYALLIWLSKFFPALFRHAFSSLEALAKSHHLIAVAVVLAGLSIVAAASHWLLSRR